jgi:hypothetical protein
MASLDEVIALARSIGGVQIPAVPTHENMAIAINAALNGIGEPAAIVIDDEKKEEKTSPPLLVLTYNIAGRVQTNEVAGSERRTVRKLQKRYSGGWVHPGRLSRGTANAIDNVDALSTALNTPVGIMGLQEIMAGYLFTGLMGRIRKKFGNGSKLRTYVNGSVVLVTDESIVGPGEELTDVGNRTYGRKSRRLQVVYFPKIETVVVNTHVQHDVDIARAIRKSVESAPRSPSGPVARVIVVGDMNDAYKSPLKQVNLYGHIVVNQTVDIRSCCDDSDYSYVGDYVMSSGPPSILNGLGTDVVEQDLASDHQLVFTLLEN